MKRQLVFGILIVAGCGGGTGGAGGNGSLSGSCDLRATTGVCIDYAQWTDPDSNGIGGVRSNCTGTWSDTAACPTQDRTASCERDGGAEDGIVHNYYLPDYMPGVWGNADDACSAGNDTWTPIMTEVMTVSVDGGAAVIFTTVGANYRPNGSDGTESPRTPGTGHATRLTGTRSGPGDMLILDFVADNTGSFDASAGEVQVILNIDGGPSGGGRGFLVQGGSTAGSVTVTGYGGVGQNITGAFDVTANEIDATMATIGTASLSGMFAVIRDADQAANE